MEAQNSLNFTIQYNLEGFAFMFMRGVSLGMVWFIINLFSYLTLEARHLATPLLMVTEKVLPDHTVILSPYTLQDIEY